MPQHKFKLLTWNTVFKFKYQRIFSKVERFFEKEITAAINYPTNKNKQILERIVSLGDVTLIKQSYLKLRKEEIINGEPSSPVTDVRKCVYHEQSKYIVGDDSDEDEDEETDNSEASKKVSDEKSEAASSDDAFEIPEDPYFFTQHKTHLVIRLVIAETFFSNSERGFKKVVSSKIEKIPKLEKTIGNFHVALIAGPWFLEWNEIGLCIPKVIVAPEQLLAHEFPIIATLDCTLPQLADKVAQIVCHWNLYFKYAETRQQNCLNLLTTTTFYLSGNSMDFVEYVCDLLNCPLPSDFEQTHNMIHNNQ